MRVYGNCGNHTSGHFNNSEGIWHAGSVWNMQRNRQGDFILAWHCDTLCLLACNLSFCTLRRQKRRERHSPRPPTPPFSPGAESIPPLNGGPIVRACSVSVANQPSRAVSSDGEKSLSDELVVLWLRRGWEVRMSMWRGGGVNELAAHLNSLSCRIYSSTKVSR